MHVFSHVCAHVYTHAPPRLPNDCAIEVLGHMRSYFFCVLTVPSLASHCTHTAELLHRCCTAALEPLHSHCTSAAQPRCSCCIVPAQCCCTVTAQRCTVTSKLNTAGKLDTARVIDMITITKPSSGRPINRRRSSAGLHACLCSCLHTFLSCL